MRKILVTKHNKQLCLLRFITNELTIVPNILNHIIESYEI